MTLADGDDNNHTCTHCGLEVYVTITGRGPAWAHFDTKMLFCKPHTIEEES